MGEQVGLIGVGKMGRALLDRLPSAGHRVTAHDIARKPIKTDRAMGAAAAANTAEAAQDAARLAGNYGLRLPNTRETTRTAAILVKGWETSED